MSSSASDRFTGLYWVLATPFAADGEVDISRLGDLVRFAVRAGARGVTALGVLGENARLTAVERERVVQEVVEAAPDGLDVVVGVSGGGERPCFAQAQMARRNGAAAIMASPPPGTLPDQVSAFYGRLAEAGELPIVVQDLPSASGVALSPALLAQLAVEQPSVVAIKLEDPPTPLKVTALKEAWQSAGTAAFSILGGLGGLFFLEELRRGADGTMTGFAYPEALTAIDRAYRSGDDARAESVFEQFMPILRYEHMPVVSLAVRKAFLHERRLIGCADVRRPGRALDEAGRAEVAAYAKRFAPLAADLLQGEAAL